MVKSPLLRSSKMPMLEMILVIGYFSVISVFILQLFLSANMLQSKAKDEGKAIVQSERIAETIKAANSFEAAKKECKLLEYSKIDDKKQIEKRMAYLIVTSVWIVMSLFGTLPFFCNFVRCCL